MTIKITIPTQDSALIRDIENRIETLQCQNVNIGKYDIEVTASDCLSISEGADEIDGSCLLYAVQNMLTEIKHGDLSL